MSSVLGESMEPFLIMRISSSPLVLFLTLLAMTLILHVVFVWLWPLRDVTLKYVDYVWLSVAAIGAFAASAKGAVYRGESAQQISYDFLRRDIKTFMNVACSPRDFNDIQQALQQMCKQYKNFDAQIPASVQ